MSEDFTGTHIQSNYFKVVHVGDNGFLHDGTGSFIDVKTSGSLSASSGHFSGDLTVDGTLEANKLLVSSSIIYSSGSTKFGDSADDTHEFTGSVFISGDLVVGGSFSGSIASASHADTASYIDWPNIDNKPSGLVSGSSQIDYNQIQNQPTTIDTASYILGSGVDGTVDNATSSSHAVNADTASYINDTTIVRTYGAQIISGSKIFADKIGVGKIGVEFPSYSLDIVDSTAGNMQIRLSNYAGDSTIKTAGFVIRHFDTSEQDVSLLYGQSLPSTTILKWGGGSPINNAVTEHNFYTAHNNTLVVGTSSFEITNTLTKANTDFEVPSPYQIRGSKILLEAADNATNLTNSKYLDLHNGLIMNANRGHPMARNGSITAIAATLNVDSYTPGAELHMQSRINGSEVFAAEWVVDATGFHNWYATQSRGIDNFAPGDIIQMYIEAVGTVQFNRPIATVEIVLDD